MLCHVPLFLRPQHVFSTALYVNVCVRTHPVPNENDPGGVQGLLLSTLQKIGRYSYGLDMESPSLAGSPV